MAIQFSGLTPPPLSAPARKVEVVWAAINPLMWGLNRVLYLYQGSTGSIFYIGKAYDCSVRERFEAHKAEGMGDLAALYNAANVMVHIGYVKPATGLLTESLVSNVEALLIRDTKPPGNLITPTATIDLEVTCSGSWPLSQLFFTNCALPPVPTYRARL